MSGTVGGVIGSRGTGVIGGKHFHRFTSGTSVLVLPSSASTVVIECIGGGGGGGGASGNAGGSDERGGGGGGGARAWKTFYASSLGPSLTVSVGALGAGGAGGSGGS